MKHQNKYQQVNSIHDSKGEMLQSDDLDLVHQVSDRARILLRFTWFRNYVIALQLLASKVYSFLCQVNLYKDAELSFVS